MSRNNAPRPFAHDADVIAIPKLTLQQSRVVMFYWEGGRTKPDRFVSDLECISAMQNRHGFEPYDAMTPLIENSTTPLLLFPVGKPLSQRHRLPETLFRNPKPLFQAVRDAEAAHNRAIDENAKKSKDDPKSGYSPIVATFEKVELTPFPEDAGAVEGEALVPATAAKIGDIVPDPEGGYSQIVAGPDGRPVLRKIEREGAPSGGTSPANKDAQKRAVARRGGPSARNKAAVRAARGHEVG